MSFRKLRLVCFTIIATVSVIACLFADMFIDREQTRNGWGQWAFLTGIAVLAAAFWPRGDES